MMTCNVTVPSLTIKNSPEVAETFKQRDIKLLRKAGYPAYAYKLAYMIFWEYVTDKTERIPALYIRLTIRFSTRRGLQDRVFILSPVGFYD